MSAKELINFVAYTRGSACKARDRFDLVVGQRWQ
jgi:hypothetical protein